MGAFWKKIAELKIKYTTESIRKEGKLIVQLFSISCGDEILVFISIKTF